MGFKLNPGQLGFKIGEVLVGLKQGTLDTPEALISTEGKLHVLGYAWNPDTLDFEAVTTSGAGLEVTVTNPSSGPQATRLDVVSDTVTYVGKAPPGTATNAAAWQVYRMTSNAEGDLTIEYADGDGEFDNVWNDRATLTYI